jgi:hypothetical protein
MIIERDLCAGFFLVDLLATADLGFAIQILVFLMTTLIAGAFSIFSIALANSSMFI